MFMPSNAPGHSALETQPLGRAAVQPECGLRRTAGLGGPVTGPKALGLTHTGTPRLVRVSPDACAGLPGALPSHRRLGDPRGRACPSPGSTPEASSGSRMWGWRDRAAAASGASEQASCSRPPSRTWRGGRWAALVAELPRSGGAGVGAETTPSSLPASESHGAPLQMFPVARIPVSIPCSRSPLAINLGLKGTGRTQP